MTRTVLGDALDHHVWATLRLIDACRELSDEQLATTVPGTYGSILDTVRHLVGADASYLSLLSGGAVPEIEEGGMALPALRATMEASRAAWAALVAQPLDAESVVTRYRDDGTQSHAPQGIRIAQVVHHGTDHRSQVCTALTSLGIEPPEIDVWAYADHLGLLSETTAGS